ncbi:hypothetical protein [Demetria terragena]|uniref:hypothetical protein n=1 Tax=Demetria terragena TaxID=63959 RepID=UPI000380BAA9|nr:hypothetical protein [Demetria terragena]
MTTRDAYTQVLLKSWSDDEFNARLDADPKGAAAEAGLAIPDNVSVTVVRHEAPSDSSDEAQDAIVDQQAALIDQGIAKGAVELHVPESPAIDGADLTSGELQATAAGVCCSCCCG